MLPRQTACEQWGRELSLGTDGTYKLEYNGWVLIVFGTHTLRLDPHPLPPPRPAPKPTLKSDTPYRLKV